MTARTCFRARHLTHTSFLFPTASSFLVAYEDHERREGKPANHALAKELVAGFAAAEVDKLVSLRIMIRPDSCCPER